jgi:multiple sugar transport system substrate-binding protein
MLLGAMGCGGGDASGPGEIVFSFGPDPSGTLQQLIERFNDQNKDNYTVKYRVMPADTGQYFDQIKTEFQAGGGEIDVLGGDVIWPAQFAANGWIADLTDRFPEKERQRYLEGPVESNIYEDKIWGVPWFTDAGLLYYRKDLLEKSGFSEAPKTWGELKKQATKVKQDSGTEFGFVFQGAQYEGVVLNTLEYVWSHGGQVLEGGSSDRVIIGDPRSVAGLETARSMIADGVAPQSVTNYKENETHATFLNGDAVFARNWPYMHGLAGDPEQSKIEQDQIGVAPLPAAEGGRSVSGLGGWNFYINASSERQDAAWEFIEFMTAPEQQKSWAVEGSYLPTLEALYDDREVLNAIPVLEQAPEAVRRTEPRPVSRYYSDMSLEMAEKFNAALKGEMEPEQAMSTLQEELQQIAGQAQ